MQNSSNSGFLLTDQTRYSEQLFAKSINRVRKRINILSTSAVSAVSSPQSPEDAPQYHHKKAPTGYCASMAKLSFEAEMLEQDLRGEMLELKKMKHMIAILAEDLRKRVHRAEKEMRMQVEDLREQANSHREAALERSRKLTVECQLRRQKGERLKERMQEAARRVSALEASLGCYTAVEKLDKA